MTKEFDIGFSEGTKAENGMDRKLYVHCSRCYEKFAPSYNWIAKIIINLMENEDRLKSVIPNYKLGAKKVVRYFSACMKYNQVLNANKNYDKSCLELENDSTN